MEANEEAKTIHPALSVRGMVIGAVGSALITASSLYIALKLGALPWPIVFAALVSLFALKALGNTSLNEANVTHTAMSAGAMVAGGLAFTIPGIWIAGYGGSISLPTLVAVALCGTVLGLAATACVRRFFIDEQKLPYPIGDSAAQTLQAANENQGTRTKSLFASMGFAGIYTFLRDWLGALPAMLFSNVGIEGVAFGIYNSPMMLAVGYMIGPVACLVWFLGGIIGDFGLVVGASGLGLWDIAFGQGLKSSLGMGVMLGCGLGIIIKQCIPVFRHAFARRDKASELHGGNAASACSENGTNAASMRGENEPAIGTASTAAALAPAPKRRKLYISASLASAAVAAIASIALQLPLLASILMVLGAWLCVLMSSQSVGVSGIDPMEVFGVLVLLLVQLLFSGISMVSLFLVAAVVAIACGLAGDVMNDFKAGSILGTSPRDQWVAQAIGGVVGAIVAAFVLYAMLVGYGADAFGTGKVFVAAQASVVAAMVAGVPSIPALVIGIAIGAALTCLGLPVMTLGLGIYLPFYITLTAGLGGLARIIADKVQTKRNTPVDGTTIAAGLLGGESLVGVIIAFATMISSLA